MNRREISRILNDIGILLELKGENVFKSRAYYNGARIIETLEGDLEEMVRTGELANVKGIGKALYQKITELVTTGKLDYYEQLKSSFPEDIFELFKIPGLGPKKVAVLYSQLGVHNIGQLEYAIMENRLVELPGFGVKTQANILKGIEDISKYKDKFLYSDAYHWADAILKELDKCRHIKRSSLAGSIRRKKEIVKDIDVLVSCDDNEKVMDYFTGLPQVERVTSKGDTKSSVILECGINVDIRAVDDSQYPYALHHFTGSKEHNTAMRHRARKMDIKINEYGLFKEKELIECADEHEFFQRLGLDYIEPELRENMGELEAAESGKLPQLIKLKDIKGCFHVHSNYSDGVSSIKDIVQRAVDLGYQYIGISDHSKSAYYARGLSLEDIKRQHGEIDDISHRFPDIKILKGIECDILPDGNLDYDDSILEQFDYVIASVHSNFNMDKEGMTARIIKAIENRHTTMLGHPTGRLLLARDEYQVDIIQIINAAAENKVAIEINANPRRLDLDWRYCKFAKEKGVKFSIEPDAHSLDGFDLMIFGINTARKGWLSTQDVLNAQNLSTIKNLLKK